MTTISSITKKKKLAEIYGCVFFFANEINTTEGDITGLTAPLKDKKNAGYLKKFFSGKQMNKQSEKIELCVM